MKLLGTHGQFQIRWLKTFIWTGQVKRKQKPRTESFTCQTLQFGSNKDQTKLNQDSDFAQKKSIEPLSSKIGGKKVTKMAGQDSFHAAFSYLSYTFVLLWLDLLQLSNVKCLSFYKKQKSKNKTGIFKTTHRNSRHVNYLIIKFPYSENYIMRKIWQRMYRRLEECPRLWCITKNSLHNEYIWHQYFLDSNYFKLLMVLSSLQKTAFLKLTISLSQYSWCQNWNQIEWKNTIPFFLLLVQ